MELAQMSKHERRKRRDGNADRARLPEIQAAPWRDDRAGLEETAEARRQREEWERSHAQAMREREQAQHELFSAFLLWTICPHKACRRAKACVGDTEECCRERWHQAVPDELRAELAKICELVRAGYDVPEACRLARQDMIMREKLLAKLEALHPPREPQDDDTRADVAPAAPAEGSEPPSPARGPRMRGL
jgi:hypothetical protein